MGNVTHSHWAVVVGRDEFSVVLKVMVEANEFTEVRGGEEVRINKGISTNPRMHWSVRNEESHLIMICGQISIYLNYYSNNEQ